jgi:glycosyltransferase involved in cell wall biosynthesis
MLNVYGPINDLGYGIVTRGLLKGLINLGLDTIHLNIVGQVQVEQNEKNNKELQALNYLCKNFWNRSFPSIAVWHEFDLSKFSGNKLIALPIFETDNFFPIAKNYLSQMDAVIVLSSWAKSVIHKSVSPDLPVFVVPAASNLLPEVERLHVPKSNAFSFLSVGKLEYRKGHGDLIQAYTDAFESE